MSDKPRILCVDDEENILKAIRRSMRKRFHVTTATGGAEALRILESTEEPFQAIVSDMRMPEMNGAEFLKLAAEARPDTVRILLTGFAEMDTVIAAINEGHIYRFISKPCSAAVLVAALEDAVRQHELLTAERVLLEQTLHGSIRALTEILALASPEAFGRATRVRQFAVSLIREVDAPDPWQIEVAAMLSQIGCITLPQQTAVRLYDGEPLSEQEQAMVARMPAATVEILGRIPRLDPVLDILRLQSKNWDGSGEPADRVAGEEIPLGARILKLALRCEELQADGATPSRIADTLRAQPDVYDPTLLKAYTCIVERGGDTDPVRGVTLHELRTGMVLTEDVRSTTGLLVVAAGQEVTVSLLERIHNYHDTVGLQEPMWVVNPEAAEAETDEDAPAAADRPRQPVV